MKIRSVIAAVLIAVILPFLTSCDNGNQYPTHLEGVWTYTNASTGYTGILSIEDIAGGQYAYFTLITPTRAQEHVTAGSFTYDASTGKGYISSGLLGGTTSVVAYQSTDSKVDVVISQIVSGGSSVSFQGSFYKKNLIEISTGKWEGQKIFEGIMFDCELEITSTEPVSGSCGVLSISDGNETKTATITEITSFAQMSEDMAIGIMDMRDDENADKISLAVIYDPVTKEIILADFEEYVDVPLSPVNVN